ncbi:MAG: glycine zipper domain-containing protein [Desulfobulbaceae bacterium]|nr:glycine zipper domain-containing protein [Desulfobulbaceae bacterium]
MLKKHLVIALCVAPLLMTSCLATKGTTGAAGGAAGGALIGQAIGHNTSSTLIGAAVGTMLGFMIGNSMDQYDQAQLNKAYETTPSSQTTRWVNPDTGNQYAMTPQSTYRDQDGRDCRDAEILATIDGKAEKTLTRACRENGRWVIQK